MAKTFSGGLYSPGWERARYPVPAFFYRLPDDEFWAAKQVMAFDDEQVRAMVNTGAFTDPRAADYTTRTLIQRRDMIGRMFFGKVLPLDRFEVRAGGLIFEDLAVKHGFHAPRNSRYCGTASIMQRLSGFSCQE